MYTIIDNAMDRDLFLKYFNYKADLSVIDDYLLEGQFKVIKPDEVFENRRLLRSFLSNPPTVGYLVILILLVILLILKSITHEEIQSTSIAPYAIIVIFGYFSIYGLYFLKNYEFSQSQYETQMYLRENYEHLSIDDENSDLFMYEQLKSGFNLRLKKKRSEPKIEKWNLYDPDWDLLDFVLNIFPWDLLRFIVFIFYISVAITLFRQPSDSLYHSFGLFWGVVILIFSGFFCLLILYSFVIELKLIFLKILNYHYIRNQLNDQYTNQLAQIEILFEQCIREYQSNRITFDDFKQYQADYIHSRMLFTQYKTTLSELPFIPNRRYNVWIIFGSPIIAFLFSVFQPLVSSWLGAFIPF